MRITKIKDIQGTERDVKFTGGNSVRFVLESDNVGFAMMKTIIPKGGPHVWHYPEHKEVCYCISGKGLLTDLKTNNVFEISPETAYILDSHEKHTFEALTDVVLISVFNPPLVGNEAHDINGCYKSNSQVRKNKAKQIVEACKNCEDYYSLYDEVLGML